MAIFSRSEKNSRASEDTLVGYQKPRPIGLRIFVVCLYLVATAFLILTQIGNINNRAVIRDGYFLRIDLANIVPESIPNAVFINSVARSIGLRDFYQVGLWNYCEGYNGEGITYCSPPQTLYWFNPVEILVSQLLAGATIALPADVTDALDIVRVASKWMFVCFLVGTILTFLCVLFAPMGFSKKPRWEHKRKRIFFRQLPITIITFLALLFTAAGAVVATVMFVIFRNVFTQAADLNISADLGTPMLAYMWIAVGLTLIGFLMQVGTCCGVCCCTGRKRAERKSQILPQEPPPAGEKVPTQPRERGRFLPLRR